MRNRYRGPDMEYDRCSQMRRIFQVAIAMSQRGYSIVGLSKKFKCSTKTSRRDIAMLERAGIPVYQVNGFEDLGGNRQYAKLYRIDKAFLAYVNKSTAGPSSETAVAVVPQPPSGQTSSTPSVWICPNCAAQMQE